MAVTASRYGKHKFSVIFIICLYLFSIILPPQKAAAATPVDTFAFAANTFTRSIGVNTHMVHAWQGSSYGNMSLTKWQLSFLGVKYVRDCFCDALSVTNLKELNRSLGIKVNMLVSSSSYDLSVATAKANPGMMIEAEGPNEIDNQNTVASLLATILHNGATLQKNLYTTLKTNANTAFMQVNTLTALKSTSLPVIGSLTAASDQLSTHIYPQWGGYVSELPEYYIQYVVSLMKPMANRKPVITEGGWWTQPYRSGVTELVHAKYTLNYLFDAYKNGIARTYLYQLSDEYTDPAATNVERHFGLFRADGSPKPAASSIRNVMQIMADAGEPKFVGKLSYVIDNMPPNGKKLLFVKSDGSYILAVWNDVRLWDNTLFKERPTIKYQIILGLGKTASSVKVYDPTLSATPQIAKTNIAGLTIMLPDHPILIEVKP